MVPVVGPFLLLGIVAWVAAIVMGVGSWFGLTPWRERWAIAGALAGLGTFELYLYTHSGMLPVLIFDPALAFPATAALFVGGGVAASYGTLFLQATGARPALEAGSPEEGLWLSDAIDRFRVRRQDWYVTGALLLPGAGLLRLGLTMGSGVELVVAGVLAMVGPLYAALGLALRGRAARRYAEELEQRRPAGLPSSAPEGAAPHPSA